MAIPLKRKAKQEPVKEAPVEKEKFSLFKKKPAEKLKVPEMLNGMYLLDTSSKEAGYLGMLRILAASGSQVPAITKDVQPSKLSSFISTTIETFDVPDAVEEVAVEPSSSGKKRIEVTML